jgi:preprotein translocase subunit SecG
MDSVLTPILLAIHIMLAFALIGVVLLQRSEGGLGSIGGGGGGMSGFMTGRGSANLLTKTTRWLAASFMATSLALAWLATQSAAPRQTTIIREPAPFEVPAVPMQDQGGALTAPTKAPATGGETAPSEPAAPTVPTNQ